MGIQEEKSRRKVIQQEKTKRKKFKRGNSRR